MKKYALIVLLIVGLTFAVIFSVRESKTIQNPASKTGVFEFQELDLGLEDAKLYQIDSIQVTEDSIYLLAAVDYSDRRCLLHYTLDLQGNVVASNLLHEDDKETYREVTYKKLLEDGSTVYIERFASGGWYYDQANYDLVRFDQEGQEMYRVVLVRKESYMPQQYIELDDSHMLAISDTSVCSINYLDGSIERWATPELLKEKIIYMTNEKQPYIVQHNEDYSEKAYYYVDLHSGAILGEYQEEHQEENQEADPLEDKFAGYYYRWKDENSGFDYVLKNILGIYGYQEETGEITEIMNYIKSDKAFSRLSDWGNIRFIDKDHFVAVQRNGANSEKLTQLFYCSRVPPEKVPDREEIVLAMNSYGRNFWDKIVAFNQSNDTYRISVEMYNLEYCDEGKDKACLEELEQRGIEADLFYISEWITTAEYEEQEYFADVYEIMQQDRSFRQREYCMNVFQACARDGKLYRIPFGFLVDTAIGKASVFASGDKFDWEALGKLKESYPEAVVYGELTKQELTDRLLQYAEDDSAEEMESKKLQKIQEFAVEYPETREEMWFVDGVKYSMLAGVDYAKNRILLVPKIVYSVMGLRKESYGYFWEETVPVGYPDEEGKGSSFLAGASFAISAESDQKEGAWEVIKYFLSKDVQMEGFDDSSEAYGLPVHKKALKKELLSMTEEIIPPADSEPRRDPDIWVWTGSESVLLPTFSKKTALRWYKFICEY